MSDTSTESLLKVKAQTEPLYLQGSAGPVFCVRSTLVGADQPENQPVVLLVPPFAEEMNRSRRFFTKLRQELIESGASEVVLPDLYGTGDSAGDFDDARWQIWTEDLCLIANQLRAENSNRLLSVVGVRAGCLLVDELASDSDVTLHNIVFVNPETSGYDVIQLLLRMRVASSRFSGSDVESTKQLWHELDTGHSVEVSGYTINPNLALKMKEKRLNMLRPMACRIGHWIELDDKPEASETENEQERNDQQWIRHRLNAKPFWQLHEHEPEDELVTAIAQCAVQVVR